MLLLCRNEDVLCTTEAFQFHKVLYINCDLNAYAKGVLFRNSSPVQVRDYSPTRFRVPGFMLTSLMHFKVTFVQSDNVNLLVFLCTEPQFYQHHLLKMCQLSLKSRDTSLFTSECF